MAHGFIAVAAFIVVLVLLGGAPRAADAAPLSAVDGIVDARDWHFPEPLPLNGAWRFAWKHLVPPAEASLLLDEGMLMPLPHMWNDGVGDAPTPGFGFASYGLRVLLPRYSSGLALRVPEINSAFRMYINGELVLSQGQVGVTVALEVPRFQAGVVLLPPAERLDILLHVSNFTHFEGGLGRAIMLGRAAPMVAERDRKVATDLLLAGAASMIGLYVFILWLQRRNTEFLLFVGVTACIVWRVVAVGRLPFIAWPELPGMFLLRVEYAAAALFLGLYPMFVERLFPGEMWKPLNRLLMAISGLVFLLSLFAPGHVFTQFRPFVAYSILATMIYVAGAAGLAVARHRPGAAWLIGSLLVLTAGVANDVLHFQRLINTTDMTALAFAAFMLGHAMVLGQRMNDAFTSVETLSRHLRDLNRGLEERVAEVTRGLRDGRNRLHAILTNVPDGIVTVDESGLVESFSPAAERLFGRTESEVVGQPVGILFSPASATDVLARLFSGGVAEGGEMEADARRHGGRSFPAGLSLSNAMLNGRPAGVIAVRDITQRRHAEAALARAKEQAEDAANARAEYLATMSHEIRTPLNGMLGMVELLRGTQLDSTQRDFVETINYSGGALLTILDDVLDASRIEAGRLSLESTVFNLPRLVRSVTDLMTPRASTKGLRVHLTVGDDVPEQVVGDPMRLRQVLLNLVSNAVKFTEEGEVAVAVSLASHSGNAGDFRFTIRDTGIGIAESMRGVLFSRFAQADASTARQYGGSGLGLFICQRIIALMGGTIDVHSAPGAGTTFTVAVPLGIERRHEARARDDVDHDVPPLSVLLVEDVEVNQRVAMAFLRGEGHSVMVASTGLEAARILREADPFDLVLMDIRLPDIDGTEVTARLRALADPVRCETPVLALTANVFPEDVDRYLRAGMNGVVAKPIQIDQLRRAVAAVINGRAPVAPTLDAAPVDASPWRDDTAPALDIAFVEDRLAGLGEAGFLPILTLGRRSVRTAVEDVLGALTGPPVGLAKAAHRLAGAASNFGFGLLFALGRRIELQVEAGEVEAAQELAHRVDGALAATQAALDEWLAMKGFSGPRAAEPTVNPAEAARSDA